MKNADGKSDLKYQCLFCGESIEPNDLDPCALNVIARFNLEREFQKEQTFFCHIGCLRSKAGTNSRNFYITDPDFPTIGEIENES